MLEVGIDYGMTWMDPVRDAAGSRPGAGTMVAESTGADGITGETFEASGRTVISAVAGDAFN